MIKMNNCQVVLLYFSFQVFIQFASKQSEADDETKSQNELDANDKDGISTPSLKPASKTGEVEDVVANVVKQHGSPHHASSHIEFSNPIIFAEENPSEINSTPPHSISIWGEGVELVEVNPQRRNSETLDAEAVKV